MRLDGLVDEIEALGPRTHTGVTISFSGPSATPDEAEEAGFPRASR